MFRNLPLEFLVNDAKITFTIKNGYIPYIFKPKRKIFMSNFFVTCHLKDDCSNPANNQVALDKDPTPVDNKVNTKGRIKF